MVDFLIRIVVDPSGASAGTNTVNKNLKRTEANAKRLGALLRRVFAFAGAAIGVRQVIRLADEFQNLQNRIRVVVNTEEELVEVTDRLFNVAQRTRSEFAATTEIYSRLALSSKELGVSQQELLEFTESLNQAVIVSGAGAQEARNGLIQFSQGLASGALRGDELRSVLEQLPVVADVISKELGITRGQLREMGAEGKITADIILRAFRNAREELEERFAKTIPTVAQSLVVLRNQAIRFFGELGQQTGLLTNLSKLILGLADNFETLIRVILAFALLAVPAAINAVLAFTVAIAANPLGALALAISATIALLISFGDQIAIGEDEIVTLQDVAVGAFQTIRDNFGILLDAFREGFAFLSGLFESVFGTDLDFSFRQMLVAAGETVDDIIGFFRGALFAIVDIWDGLPGALGDLAVQAATALTSGIEVGIKAVVSLIDGLVTLFKTVGLRISDFFRNIANSLQFLLQRNFSAAKDASDAAVLSINGIGSAFKDVPKNVENAFKGLEDRNLLGVTFNNRFEGQAKNLGKNVAGAFAEGFEFDLGSRFIDETLARADDRAQQRAFRRANVPEPPDLTQAGPGVDVPAQKRAAALKQILGALAQETALLKLNSAEREIQATVLDVVNKAREKGIEFGEVEQQLIENQVRANQALAIRAELLEQIRGPQEEFNANQAALNALFEQGAINALEFANASADLQNKLLSNRTDVASGFRRGLNVIARDITDFATVTEQTLVNAFQGAEDALVSFVTTGKADFSGLVDSILADLTRLLARQALVALIKALGGGEGGNLFGTVVGALGGGSRQGGGPVAAGQAVTVGEGGREIFRPDVPGTIIPNEQVEPQMNVTVVNVSDPDEVASALNTPEGEQIVLNILQRNRETARRVLQ